MGMALIEENEKDYQTFDGDASTSNEKLLLEYTVDEAISHIGFGRAQLRLVFMAGFVWIADGMEIMVLSILGPTLACMWGISAVQSAFLTTIVFLGFSIGSCFFGSLADKHGRQTSLLISSFIGLLFGVCSGLSLNYTFLVIFRFGVGLGVGGAPQAITYYAEFLPMEVRGKAILFILLFFSAGGFCEVLLAIVVLEPLGWRWWLIFTATPLVIFIVFWFFLPKSPRYLLACGKVAEAQQVLQRLADENGTNLPKGELIAEEKVPRGQISDLLSPQFGLTTGLLALIWFASAFLYYGIVLLTTQLVADKTNCNSDSNILMNGVNSTETIGDCKPLTNNDYVELLWTSAAELPSLLLTAVFIDILGRKLLMGVDYLLFTIFCFVLMICMTKAPMILLLSFTRAFIASSFQICYLYTLEIYPTQVRALSVGLGSGCARIGVIITPYVAEVLIKISAQLSLGVYAAVSVITTIAVFLLPIETKGQQLQDSNSLQKSSNP